MKLINVSKTFKKDSKEISALKNINLDISNNGIYVIKGPSGSGKTTLLKVIGLLYDFEGEYELNNRSVKELSNDEKCELRNKYFGFVFQEYALFDYLNAYENVLVPSLKDKEKAINLLKKVGLEDRINHYPRELSGGENRRVAFARALINDPSVILADEPTASLDTLNKEKIYKLLLELKDDKCIIIATHDEKIEQIANKIYNIEKGEVRVIE